MGKSTVAACFAGLGARVVDTDEIARRLVQPGQPALAEIQNVFGPGVLAPGGVLHREALARLVFSDPVARRQLEAILHPRIRETWLAQVGLWRREKVQVALVVIPLLFETAAGDQFEKILCAACSPAAQQQRLAARGWSPEQIRQRVAAQWPVEQKMARSHFVLWMEGRPESSAAQAVRVFRRL